MRALEIQSLFWFLFKGWVFNVLFERFNHKSCVPDDMFAAFPFAGPMMHQQPPSQQYNMPQAGGQHYQGQQPPMGMMGQVNQGNHMMGQRQIPPYRPPQQGRT